MLVEVLLNPIDDFTNQVVGSSLELEHALIMLLLLVGLLSIHDKYERYVPWVIISGVALSLFTPVHIIDPAWPIISALVLPPLLWQVALRLSITRPIFSWRSILAWLLMIILIAIAIRLGSNVSVAKALLIGILAASLTWQLRERAIGSSDLGAFGQLTLALLLVEVDVELHPVGPFLGTLISSVALGLVLGFIGVRITPRLPAGTARNHFYLAMIYIAYLAGILIGISGITMAIATGMVIASGSYSMGLWANKEEWPAPLKQRWIFLLMAVTWLILGWQAHVALTANHLTGIGLALIVVTIGVLAGRWIAPIPDASVQPLAQSLLKKGWKIFLLLLGFLLLWPPETVLSLFALAVALLAALVIIIVLRIVIYQILDMAGIELKWPG